jgi:GrpB-like predicted nucleotidyltransferase (UPF0157 family)
VSDTVPPWAYAKPEIHAHNPLLSTAVPGLAAKPIIDLMASVRDPDAVVDQAGELLAADSWCYVPPELDSGGSWRRFFVKPDESGQHRYAHLHVIAVGHPPDREAYTDAKGEFVRDALGRDVR